MDYWSFSPLGTCACRFSASDAFLSPLEIEAGGDARAGRKISGAPATSPRSRRCRRSTRGRAVVVARKPGVISGLPLVGLRSAGSSPRDRDRGACARRRGDRRRRQADDHRGRRARHSRRRAHRAQFPRPHVRHRHRDRGIRQTHRRTPRRASSARARPRPACARWKNTPCAAAAASITASASTTRC